MQYIEEIAGSHTANKDGTERSKIIREYLGPEGNKRAKPVLVRETDNPHDKNAVAVYVSVDSILNAKFMQIGYLSRDTAEEVAYFMDSGGRASNVEIQRVWIPHFEHVTPVVTISFDASWSEEDVEYWENMVEAEEERGAQEVRREAGPVGMKEVNQVYGWTPYIWLAIIIFIFWGISRI